MTVQVGAVQLTVNAPPDAAAFQRTEPSTFCLEVFQGGAEAIVFTPISVAPDMRMRVRGFRMV